MKTVKGTVLCCMSISLAIVALGCGNAIEGAAGGWPMLGYAIEGAAGGWPMLGYAFLALAMLFAALILAAIGVSTENERMEQENRKIKRIPHHTNEWRDAK